MRSGYYFLLVVMFHFSVFASERPIHELTEVANAGDVSAQLELGQLYKYGVGVEQDFTKAAKWLQRAALKDDPTSMYELGMLYLEGQGVTKNEQTATFWLESAAHMEHVNSQVMLGWIQLKGYGVKKNVLQALTWGRSAARQNSLAGMELLASAYLADSPYRDVPLAVEWFEKAAEGGYVSAQYQLGKIYYDGILVPQDSQLALLWIDRSAQAGLGDAQKALADFYKDGFGVGIDLVKAYVWSSLAVANGADAKALRDELAKLLSPDELRVAQKEAKVLFNEQKGS
ncbi:tetratricopeptide repeat protein [Shewanella xiamenensis]|uniref:tetratricopeptide repeat protein n=1 Tax=Shewanella xiamenensis TaxID=332186 RepID=UPI0024A76F0D|nr:tetratricopeptide repeat protein [Shewanella xiamenensis]MDI5836273.1 SEL1-like repeat protein [Shewanella xiamenensis]MDI5840252.1 SEL1-like repeat protein [Shewanella xiamenensis]MDI5844191.1 SEL1-like repeat protein [Shewanella xiamenensis]MDI5847246.1 SEL1-like repeat protein [Shewanella xiamenensis]MDI5852148.1 SEL1-like repeat protein [Shewanella xiamenensis]